MLALAFIFALFSFSTAIANQDLEISNPFFLYDEIIETVNQNFYDKTFRDLPWSERTNFYRKQLTQPVSDQKFKSILNSLLSELKVSHTGFFSHTDQNFWALKSIWTHKIDGAPLWQVGAFFKNQKDQWFVSNVLEGSPAQKAGLKIGDEILSVEGNNFEPVLSFNSPKPITITLLREKSGKPTTLLLRPQFQSFQRSMLTATRKSQRVITIKSNAHNLRIGYVHLWAGTHEKFLKELHQAFIRFSRDTDALILDLRDGFGGAHPEFIAPLYEGESKNIKTLPIYSKPVVALINEGTRSGKEWVSYHLKKSKRAALVGTTTAGAFIGGRAFEIKKNKYILYLAVEHSKIPEITEPIEGVGVAPDIEVQTSLPYAQGSDPQLEKAIEIAREKASPSTSLMQ